MLQAAASLQRTSASPQTVLPASNVQSPQPPSPTLDTKPTFRTKVRLPSTIEPGILTCAQASRQAFTQAVANDQRAALQPSYSESFHSANDVVKRLLPYHVWHVNDDDLRCALEDSASSGTAGRCKRVRNGQDDEKYPTSEEAYRLFSRYSRIDAHARKLHFQLTGGASTSEGAPFSKESLYNIEKLALEQEKELLASEQEKLRQAKEMAIEAGVKWEDLMRLGPTLGQVGSNGSTDVQEQFAKEEGAGQLELTSSAKGTTSSPFSPISFQKSVGSMQSNTDRNNLVRSSTMIASTSKLSDEINGALSTPPRPGSSATKPSKTRGRPRKTRDEDGKIIATPPAGKPAPNQTATHTPSSAAVLKSNTSNAGLTKQVPTSARTNPTSSPITTVPAHVHPPKPLPSPAPTPSPATIIPSHPIPLVLPLSTLSRLSSLGIAPIPAPHLLPAINAQQAQAHRQGQGDPPTAIPISQSVHSTAPRSAPPNQVEPALLMGITEAPLPRTLSNTQGRSTGTMQQMLHVSVVLSKLSPSQLSGLAALMQSLQNTGANKTGTGASDNGSNSSKTARNSSDETDKQATSQTPSSRPLLPSNDAFSDPHAPSE
ncbi:hypothetical protein CBS101457_000465 [Exobasidium rhododendri]|nr:hypothetical protein CBS101457_000465 [Exobasidium rhododendri]